MKLLLESCLKARDMSCLKCLEEKLEILAETLEMKAVPVLELLIDQLMEILVRLRAETK